MASTAKDTLNRAASTARAAAKDALADPSVEDVAAELQVLRADLSRLVDSVAALGRTKSGEAAQALGETAEELRRRGAEGLAAAKEQGEHALERASETLRRHPTETLLAVAGIGFIVGLIAGRR